MSSSTEEPIKTDVIVIGAGISGLVTAKCLKESGFKVIVLERTGEVGGLWTYREHDYGVMRFTHINVSKYNYCFSDFPFGDSVPDYPHNVDMAKYIVNYTKHFELDKLIKFNRRVTGLEKTDDGWKLTANEVRDDGKTGEVTDIKEIYLSKFVAIATGHHATPTMAHFPGQDSFTGELIHSVKYKDVVTNGMIGKRVLVVGIGNSAVDIATNCASVGRCKSVYISTRSGAWIVPNYIFGHPTDLYACRAFFMLPWKLANFIFENVIKLVSGNPKKWNLNPKMQALQTQPTVSPTLIHHIQRKNIVIVPNIQRIEGSRVYFMNGDSQEFDCVVMCTGYRIDVPYLSTDLQQTIFDSHNHIKLYKNVFHPETGHSLAFIGFVQPASGGILSMSETQARWFAELCKNKVTLPTPSEMKENIKAEEEQMSSKYYRSDRHTMQKDPILYNDEIASFIGAKPEIFKHPTLAWRLLLGSCGAAQWRLQGPNKWPGAADQVRKVPLTELMHYGGFTIVALLFGLLAVFLYMISGIF